MMTILIYTLAPSITQAEQGLQTAFQSLQSAFVSLKYVFKFTEN